MEYQIKKSWMQFQDVSLVQMEKKSLKQVTVIKKEGKKACWYAFTRTKNNLWPVMQTTDSVHKAMAYALGFQCICSSIIQERRLKQNVNSSHREIRKYKRGFGRISTRDRAVQSARSRYSDGLKEEEFVWIWWRDKNKIMRGRYSKSLKKGEALRESHRETVKPHERPTFRMLKRTETCQ